MGANRILSSLLGLLVIIELTAGIFPENLYGGYHVPRNLFEPYEQEEPEVYQTQNYLPYPYNSMRRNIPIKQTTPMKIFFKIEVPTISIAVSGAEPQRDFWPFPRSPYYESSFRSMPLPYDYERSVKRPENNGFSIREFTPSYAQMPITPAFDYASLIPTSLERKEIDFDAAGADVEQNATTEKIEEVSGTESSDELINKEDTEESVNDSIEKLYEKWFEGTKAESSDEITNEEDTEEPDTFDKIYKNILKKYGLETPDEENDNEEPETESIDKLLEKLFEEIDLETSDEEKDDENPDTLFVWSISNNVPNDDTTKPIPVSNEDNDESVLEKNGIFLENLPNRTGFRFSISFDDSKKNDEPSDKSEESNEKTEKPTSDKSEESDEKTEKPEDANKNNELSDEDEHDDSKEIGTIDNDEDDEKYKNMEKFDQVVVTESSSELTKSELKVIVNADDDKKTRSADVETLINFEPKLLAESDVKTEGPLQNNFYEVVNLNENQTTENIENFVPIDTTDGAAKSDDVQPTKADDEYAQLIEYVDKMVEHNDLDDIMNHYNFY